jgi:hypothetical protein
VNGDFETNTLAGWTLAGGVHGGIGNYFPLPGDTGRLAVVGLGNDPVLAAGAVAFQQVFSGNHSVRVENSSTGARWSSISQSVVWTDNSINFAWAAVLQEPGHSHSAEPHFQITLRNETDNTVLYSVLLASDTIPAGILHSVNAGVHGLVKYTDYQTITLDTSAHIGDTLKLTLLAADCQLTAHFGYVYLDGFGAVTPQPNAVSTPEPASCLIWGLGSLGLGFVGYRRRQKKA